MSDTPKPPIDCRTYEEIVEPSIYRGKRAGEVFLYLTTDGVRLEIRKREGTGAAVHVHIPRADFDALVRWYCGSEA